MLDDTSPLADVVAVLADPLHGLPVCHRHPTGRLGSGTSPPLRGAICVYAHALEAGMCVPLQSSWPR
jgi:hypothetical protein